MKILRIRFKNLNSLAGEWEIDLTDPIYVQNGIFAITGPTGAGKSTLLDAICLALYGRTPRLDRISKSSNEIMSRHTGECWAEVTFETQAGRYLCRWSQRRARLQPGGELQQPAQEISRADTGEILSGRIRETAGIIEEITGMDFDRFTRSMLLAQGGFAAFLQAGADARAPILEQITGTGIYSTISRQVHDRLGRERTQLAALEAEKASLQMLSPEEEETLAARQATILQEAAGLRNKIAKLREVAAWREHLDRLLVQQIEVDEARQVLDRERAAFDPEQTRLDLATRAARVDPAHLRLASLQQDQHEETNRLEQLTHEQPQREKEAVFARNALTEAEEALSALRAGQQDAIPALRAIRELDQQLEEREAREQAAAEEEKAKESTVGDLRAQSEALENTSRRLEEERAKLEEEIIRRGEDEQLHDRLPGIRQRCELYGKAHRALADCADRLDKARDRQNAAAQQLSALVDEEKERQGELSSIREQIGALSTERAGLLGGRTVVQCREERMVLSGRQTRLDQAKRRADLQRAARERIARWEADRQKIACDIEQAQREVRESDLRIGQLDARIGMLQSQRELNRVQLLYAQARRTLAEGTPCPVCGSTSHPFHDTEIVPDPDVQDTADLPEEEKAAEQERIQAQNTQVAARIRLASLEKSLEGLDGQLSEKRREAGSLESELASDREALASVHGARLDAAVPPEQWIAERESALGILVAENASLLGSLDRLEEALENARTSLGKQEAQSSDRERDGQIIRDEASKTIAETERLQTERDGYIKIYDARLQEIQEELAPYSVETPTTDAIPDLLRVLDERAGRARARGTRMAELLKEANELSEQRVTVLERKRQAEASLEEARRRRAVLQKERENLRADRTTRYGARDPDQEEKALSDSLRTAEQALSALRETSERAESDFRAHAVRIDALQNSLVARAGRIQKAEMEFANALAGEGFADEEGFRVACLTGPERAALQAASDDLEKRHTGLLARGGALTRQIEQEEARALTTQPVVVLREETQEHEQRLSVLDEETGALRQQLSAHEEAVRRHGLLAQRIASQDGICRNWERLHGLIGSADGKKFRNFAQGVTFDLLIGHANHQLSRLSDRYLLVRDPDAPLELAVIDNDQAGDIRSTRNLSGGESFLVSLSLALGLSRMSSRKVRVDSLFLDEGFGTLDDDTLESALETLAGLRQEGKLIGLISHVPAIRERIPAKIQVIPTAGGRSRLVGPGCVDCSSRAVSI